MEEMKNSNKTLTESLTCFFVGIIGSTHFLTCFRVGPHTLYIYLKKEKNKGSGFLIKTGTSLKNKGIRSCIRQAGRLLFLVVSK